MKNEDSKSYGDLSNKWFQNGLICAVGFISSLSLFLYLASPGNFDTTIWLSFLAIVLCGSMMISFGISSFYAMRMGPSEKKSKDPEITDQNMHEE